MGWQRGGGAGRAVDGRLKATGELFTAQSGPQAVRRWTGRPASPGLRQNSGSSQPEVGSRARRFWQCALLTVLSARDVPMGARARGKIRMRVFTCASFRRLCSRAAGAGSGGKAVIGRSATASGPGDVDARASHDGLRRRPCRQLVTVGAEFIAEIRPARGAPCFHTAVRDRERLPAMRALHRHMLRRITGAGHHFFLLPT